MPAIFFAALIGALGSALASLAGRALIGIGIGFVTYKGISVALDSIRQNLVSSVSSIPGEALGLLGYLYVDKALTLIFSAVTISLSIRLLNGGVKKMVAK